MSENSEIQTARQTHQNGCFFSFFQVWNLPTNSRSSIFLGAQPFVRFRGVYLLPFLPWKWNVTLNERKLILKIHPFSTESWLWVEGPSTPEQNDTHFNTIWRRLWVLLVAKTLPNPPEAQRLFRILETKIRIGQPRIPKSLQKSHKSTKNYEKNKVNHLKIEQHCCWFRKKKALPKWRKKQSHSNTKSNPRQMDCLDRSWEVESTISL